MPVDMVESKSSGSASMKAGCANHDRRVVDGLILIDNHEFFSVSLA